MIYPQQFTNGFLSGLSQSDAPQEPLSRCGVSVAPYDRQPMKSKQLPSSQPRTTFQLGNTYTINQSLDFSSKTYRFHSGTDSKLYHLSKATL